jgi:predicted Co/Zn/Cd cation transporter (cation efflux family)
LLICATAATVWVIWGVAGSQTGLLGGSGIRLVDLGDCARLGLRSIVVVALCAGVVVCATRPIRRGRADYAKLAFAQVVLAGLLLAVVMVGYWLFWSPISFIK